MRLYRLNDSGEPVRDIQDRLLALGYRPGPDAAGEFGEATDRGGSGLSTRAWSHRRRRGRAGDLAIPLRSRLPAGRSTPLSETTDDPRRGRPRVAEPPEPVGFRPGPGRRHLRSRHRTGRPRVPTKPQPHRGRHCRSRGHHRATASWSGEPSEPGGKPSGSASGSAASRRAWSGRESSSIRPAAPPKRPRAAWAAASAAALALQGRGGLPMLARAADISLPERVRAGRANRQGAELVVSFQLVPG